MPGWGLAALPPWEQTLQFDVKLAQFLVCRRRRHDGGPWLDGLPRLRDLLRVLSKVGEIGLEAANVAGAVSMGASTVM